MIDAFLRLKTYDGSPVDGESSATGFERAIEIREFDLGDRANAPGKLAAATDERSAQQAGAGLATLQKGLHAELKKHVADREAKRADAERKRKQLQILRTAQTDLRPGMMRLKEQVADELAKRFAPSDDAADGDRLTFQVTKDIDAASADLFQAYCATAVQPNPVAAYQKMGLFQSAEVTLRKWFDGTPKPYLVCLFTQVAVHAYQMSYDDGRDHIIEKVTFKFVKYTMRYQSQTLGGTLGVANPETSGSVSGDA